MKRLNYLAACILSAGMLLSCSKNNDELLTEELSSRSARTSTENPNYPGTVVHITSAGYDPVWLNVPAGSDVTWVNQDAVTHTVTANDGSFNSGDIPAGGTYGQKFTVIDDYAYHCQYHPNEKGMVDVKGIK